MDPAMLEQYADWLDNLEKSDPKAYAQFVQEMQAKVQSGEAGNLPSKPEELRFPGNKVMQEAGIADKKEGIYVDVTPGFVMKTMERKSQTKLFVNICTSEHIQVFSKKKQLDENGEEQEGIHVPLSLGPPHEVVDHAQKTCLAIDVAVNPGVLEDCNSDPTFRNFVCELALEYLAQKYKFECDPQYKLPKLTYRGTLPPPRHYIRKTQTPVIQEVSRPTPVAPPKELATPTLRLFENSLDVECTAMPACEGGPAVSPASLDNAPANLVAQIQLTAILTAADIDVQANAEYIVVSASGHHDIAKYLPYPVQVENVSAALSGTVLTITLPVDKSWAAKTDGADIGSSPWMLAQAVAQDTPVPQRAVDRFHVGSVEPKSASQTPIQEDEVLPEDRFHQRDMMSMHILDQRRRDKEQKAEKAAAEHAARKAEAERKQAAAAAAGKTWAEMYPNEPETTFVDLAEMLNPKPAPILASQTAQAVAKHWKQDKQAVQHLKSSLAFELLE
ncbi:hypothetical protein AC1031_013791 [Aphanomyces cochlioides]|nr:hypothetical protein AC1031_013791 [Aphanomyces cochlioides]